MPRGRPATWKPTDNAETERGRRRENESAQVYAEHGFDVEQNPSFPGAKDPDFRIEGKIFDSFAPARGKSVRNIWSVARGKVADDQTRRVSLNLDDSDVSIDQLKEQFGRWHIQDLEEVIVVRDRKIYRIFP
jgi:contact-dependent growth inhibition (CDI) system CdiA-like toxin